MGVRLRQNIERVQKSAEKARQASMLDKAAAVDQLLEDLIDCLEEIERSIDHGG